MTAPSLGPIDPFTLSWSAILRSHRRRRNWSQTELADRTGWSLSYIWRMENGHLLPGRDTVRLLADLFNLEDQARARFYACAGLVEHPPALHPLVGTRRK